MRIGYKDDLSIGHGHLIVLAWFFPHLWVTRFLHQNLQVTQRKLNAKKPQPNTTGTRRQEKNKNIAQELGPKTQKYLGGRGPSAPRRTPPKSHFLYFGKKKARWKKGTNILLVLCTRTHMHANAPHVQQTHTEISCRYSNSRSVSVFLHNSPSVDV